MKFIFLFCLLSYGLSGFSQENIDSVEVSEDIRTDTLKTNLFGYCVGLHSTYPIINESNNSDTITDFNGDKQLGIILGIHWLRKLNEKFYLQSGVRISVSKLNFQFKENQKLKYVSLPFHTFDIPLNIVYIPHFKKNSLTSSFGLCYSLDITRSEDKDTRIIKLKSNNLAINCSLGYGFVNQEGTHFDTRIFFSYGFFNLLSSSANAYSSSLKNIRQSRISLIVTIF